MGDVWRRIGEKLNYFHDRMADPKAVFRDSTVTNVHELLGLIPGLNVLDDPNVEEVRKMIEKSLGGVVAKEVRKDPEFRAELADESKAILDKMGAMMSAFGHKAAA